MNLYIYMDLLQSYLRTNYSNPGSYLQISVYKLFLKKRRVNKSG